MAQIRCPSCDTVHDLDDAFLATGRRKVRCASCRTIWEAEEPESDSFVTVALPLPEPKRPRPNQPGAGLSGVPAANAAEMALDGPAPVAVDVDVDSVALDQSAIDSMDFGPEDSAQDPRAPDAGHEPSAEADAPPLASAMDADISADDLEALFADEAPAPAVEPQSADGAPIKEFDPASLAMAQDAAAAAALREEAAVAKSERRANRGTQKAAAPRKSKPPAGRGSVLAAMVMAASIGTLATLVLLRQETVRLFPGTAKVFDAVGISASARGLDITDIQSQMVNEDGRETLEVSGKIINNAKTTQKVPVLRLSIRGGSGNELYVWTATADQPELGPGETLRFHRRLASPPAESHSVMVRFVAKDDIVAAIH